MSPGRAAHALFLLLLLPFLAIHSEAADSGPWIITGHESCTGGRLVVDRNITVKAGAVLELAGCILAIDSPAYDDRPFAAQDEGLVLRVEAGGLLRLVASPGRPAGLERADDRYGYTVKVDGDFESAGLPDAHNTVRGLEGAHEAQLGFGGFQVRGTATVYYTDYDGNRGPSLFMLDGSTLKGDHLSFGPGGTVMATRAERVHLSDVEVETFNGALVFSTTPDILVDGCTLRGGLLGVYVTLSKATLRDCAIDADAGAALQILNAEVQVYDSALTYGRVGVQVAYKGKYAALQPNILALSATSVSGIGPNATSALTAASAEMSIVGGRLSSVAGPVINSSLGSMRLSGVQMDGPSTGLRAEDPIGLSAEALAGTAEPRIDVWRTTRVKVERASGDAVANATVTLPGATAVTGAGGEAVLRWHWFSADAVARLNHTDDVPLSVDPPSGRTVTTSMQADQLMAQVVVTGGQGKSWLVAGALAVGTAGAVAAAWALKRRR